MSNGSILLRLFGAGDRSRVPVQRQRRGYSVMHLESLEERWMLSAYGNKSFHSGSNDRVAAEVSFRSDSGAHPTALHSSKHAHHGRAGFISALSRLGQPALSGNPMTVGSWTSPVLFKPPGAIGAYVATHMTLLPNGMVLTWPHDYNYFLKYKHAAPWTPDIMLWDPATNRYQKLPLLRTNIFCSGSTFLPDGDLMILGGHGPAAIPVHGLQTHYGSNHAVYYEYDTKTWSAAPKMAEGRYYGSAITLGNGSIIAVAGYNEDGGNNPLIEIFTEGQGWRTLTGATTSAWRDWYPNIYQLSNGLIFGANPPRRSFFIDPSGSGKIWPGPLMNFPRRFDGASVMYAQDRILSLGGNAARGSPPTGGTKRQITKTAETISLDDPNPTWRYTGSMRFPRLFPSATLLPDGTVLVTGGTSQQDNSNGNALRGAVYAAELWDPKTGQWSTMSRMSVPRLDHSTAVLLPDGRVLVAGGGEPESTGEAKGTTHQNMQIFSPPYLFRGPQPVISSAPNTARYGQTISVTSPDATSITKINLVRPGSMTHGFNMTQKIVNVPFDRAADGTLELHLPTNPNNAPPGPYMIFLLNNLGVPSKASMFSLTS